MKKINIPGNINQILEEEGIWEDESFDPIIVTVMESEYKGKDVIGFQMEFPAWEKLGDINQLLEEQHIELDGDEWENLIRKYVKTKNSKLEKTMHGDSEGETCVLWTESKEEFEEMMNLIFELIDTPVEIKDLM